MKRKLLVIFLFVFAFCMPLIAQAQIDNETKTENNAESNIAENANTSETEETIAPTEKTKKHPVNYIFTLEPLFIINTSPSKLSSSHQIVFPITFSIKWPTDTLLSFQPRLSFFMNYYLWNQEKKMAMPAEIENRTTTALSFLLTLPLGISFYPTEKSTIELQVGFSALLRFAILSKGVLESDIGSSGSAKSDLEEIRTWLLGRARWLYFDTGFSWQYNISDRIKIGPEIRLYLPLGSLFENRGVDSFMISAGLKITL